MITITLSRYHGKNKGKYQAIVSDKDEKLAELSWMARVHPTTGKVYAFRYVWENGKNKTLYLHRVVLEEKIERKIDKGEETYFVDENPLNCCRENLLLAKPTNNRLRSGKKRNDNTSGVTGVYRYRDGWKAEFTIDGVAHTHTTKSFEEACEKRNEFEKEFYKSSMKDK